MKKNAAELAVYALEQLGIRHTFGIPGVHNTELYDALNNSTQIKPVLVTHEGGAAFMADGVSRSADWHQHRPKEIGVLVIVPAAGFTHAASGIGEAFLDGIPMLVISGGIRTDTGRRFQLHGIDQLQLAKPITKAAYRINHQSEVIETLYQAYQLATSGKPGPVLVEIPVNLQLFKESVPAPMPYSQFLEDMAKPENSDLSTLTEQALQLLSAANKPAMFVGWGARHAKQQLVQLAEKLQMPVATTLQGLASFPHQHPLHAGFGFSPSAVPAAQYAFADCDVLLAIGTRFSEIPTGSFSAEVPDNLIHVDIDDSVFNQNYPAKVAIPADALEFTDALLEQMADSAARSPDQTLVKGIKKRKADYQQSWLDHDSGDRVNPAHFFNRLRKASADDAITVLDDGNHTFLTAELYPLSSKARLLTPTDFNAMGYAVPAAIGAQFTQPEKQVFAIVGDGCFLMTCMEISTAVSHALGVIYFIFNDGELSQIAQAQQIPYNRKPCTQLGPINFEGVAQATGAGYLEISNNDAIEEAIQNALKTAAKGVPVIVNVAIDYSKQTAFTAGTARTTFSRFPLKQRLRIGARAIARKLSG
ncbi:thiamine pyrophosphate-binding protein [Idiomarina seosinensis]|uniref:thiamine pyrophosphate-binding protein n=1 Tax=Idiomarina seosinensis TaxID=281739 RepID=UPI00384A6B89